MNEQLAPGAPELKRAAAHAAWALLAQALNRLEALGLRPAISLTDGAVIDATAERTHGLRLGTHVRRTVDVLEGPCWVVMDE